MNKQEIKLFESFLKKRRVYSKFKRNLFKESGDSLITYLNNYSLGEGFVEGSFYWEGTLEGHDFWDKINKEWLSFLYKNKTPEK